MKAKSIAPMDERALRSALLNVVKGNAALNKDARTSVPDRAKVTIPLKGIKPTSVQWLWEGRIPLGKLTIIDGNPGEGKSAVTLDLAARVSRGARMPDGTPGIMGNVVVMNAEDDLSDSIVPRLMSAGANMDHVFAVKTIEDKFGERLPGIPEDIEWIKTAVRRTHASLVVIDPLFAYMSSGASSWGSMRKSLGPLAALAHETGAAFVLVRHLTKGQGVGNPLYRGGGSMAIAGSARSAMLVGRDVDNPDQSYLIHTKSNMAAFPMTLPFKRVPTKGTLKIAWGKPVKLTAEEFFERSDAALELARLLREDVGELETQHSRRRLSSNGNHR